MRRLLATALAILLIALTALAIQGALPDAARHEQTLDALGAIHLHHAALDRDVLRARAGLLRNYDPLVAGTERLHKAVDDLRAAAHAAGIAPQVEAVSATVSDREGLIERFKSANATMQNSLSYFSHTAQEFRRFAAAEPDALAAVGALGNAMLRFLNAPQDDNAAEVRGGLRRLAETTLPAALQERSRALAAHGEIVLTTLPAVDETVRGLLAPRLAEQTRSAQDAYLAWHGRAAARADLFRRLLYAASILLAAYLAYLFVRLQRGAQALRARLALETLIGSISTRFINLPSERLGDGIADGLARLAEHADVDRAQIIPVGDDAADAHAWRRADIADDAAPATLASSWSLPAYRHGDAIHVPRVAAMPAGHEKDTLQRHGIRSWLCVPMGGHLLVLDAVRGERPWAKDDIAMLRTAGEIFASAMARGRAEAERETLEARLHQAQRLEAVGTLAGGIAHEFNNVLGGIMGHAELAIQALPQGSRPRHHAERVLLASERARSIVDQILAFSRRRERRHRAMAVEPVVRQALELLRASLPATITLRSRLALDDAAIRGDPTQLQQIIINFCNNAAQASRNRGTLDVVVDTIEIAQERALSHGRLAPAGYVRVSVTDSGHGIDAAHMARIFEPFFTTKAVGAGTGLGLSTVHGIVTEHGGSLNVISQPGRGSTFEAYLPRLTGPVDVIDEAEAPPVRGNGETILLVDDETSLVRLGEEMLAALGYEPVGFDSSTAALAAVREDPQRFDAVLTDEVMPTMTGSELAAALQEIRPALPIVIMTGYAASDPERGPVAGVRARLKKPLLSADLARCLGTVLAEPPASPRALQL